MSSHFRTIFVLDGNGDEVMLYEIRERALLLGLIVRKRFQLCTGEPVLKRGGAFIVEATGEKLIRVRGPR